MLFSPYDVRWQKAYVMRCSEMNDADTVTQCQATFDLTVWQKEDYLFWMILDHWDMVLVLIRSRWWCCQSSIVEVVFFWNVWRNIAIQSHRLFFFFFLGKTDFSIKDYSRLWWSFIFGPQIQNSSLVLTQ